MRLMLADGGGNIGDGQKGKEFDELRERLRISETLMMEMSKTWEEKLKETERVHQVSTCTLCVCVCAVWMVGECMYV